MKRLHGLAALWMLAGSAMQPPTHIDAIRCEAATPRVTTSLPLPPLRWQGTLIRWAEWPVVLGADGVRNRLIVAVVDPRRVVVSLDIVRQGDGLGAWSLDDAPVDAVLAVNAGQFTDAGPWGWVRHHGREQQGPGAGALAAAFVVDTANIAAILRPAEIASARNDPRWREALQSYPHLLDAGRPVAALCAGDVIDRTHRDARLVLGLRADGLLLVVLSRYAGTGTTVAPMAERVPIGPTTPEMAEVMRRLGAVDALMLDGGLSAQLMLRDRGVTHRWPGLRSVPLALVARRR